jgi:hypothetical protein
MGIWLSLEIITKRNVGTLHRGYLEVLATGRIFSSNVLVLCLEICQEHVAGLVNNILKHRKDYLGSSV